MDAPEARRDRPLRGWLLAAALSCTGAAGHTEPGPPLPVLEGRAGAAVQLPDFRSDLVELPRYRNPAGARPVEVGPAGAAGSLRLGYDRGLDEHQLRTPPPLHERMRANMRDPQPATVFKLDLR